MKVATGTGAGTPAHLEGSWTARCRWFPAMDATSDYAPTAALRSE